MEKTLKLALNRFTAIPSSLRNGTALNCPAAEITIQLADLYLHYYLDSFGRLGGVQSCFEIGAQAAKPGEF
jgi:hypothetical protein